MKYRSILYFILFLLGGGVLYSACAGGDNPKYDVSNIPAALRKDAEAVVRYYNIRFETKNKQRAVYKVKQAVTVFKKEKRDYGYLELSYDKFSELEDLDGTIYNAHGKIVRELEKNDTKDYCAYSDYSLFKDSRRRVAELYNDQYPYTVEFTYEYSYNGYLNWPEWISRTTLDPIEQSRMEVVIPEEDTLRYWCNSDSVKPNIAIYDSKKVYLWELWNSPKLTKEEAGNEIEDVATIVHLAPSLFEFGDYPGDMRTWKDFGTWDYSLIKGRDLLPESAKHVVHALVGSLSDTKKKVKVLYEYMQKRTRYVNVTLGIGGWQPFDAAFVHEHAYGDCKALSNYMVALLKEAGITAYPFLVLHGSDPYPFIHEFPSNQFNHMMVCIPMKDTIWLECTSQSIPFGHIGGSTENRGVLLLTPEGGIVAHTPRSTPHQNEQRRNATVDVSYFGSTIAHVTVTRTGDQQDYVRGALFDESPEERERWVIHDLDVPNATLKQFSIYGLESHDLTIGIDMQIVLPRFASVSGDRLFFQPNLMERKTYIPPDVPKRLAPIRYDYPYYDADSICYKLPVGFRAESVPTEVHLLSSFGEFHAKTLALGDTAIAYTRSFELREYFIPAKNYAEYRKFYTDVVKSDRAQVVLMRKK
jgi:transglutaminase-like putative cysteine protease